VPIKNKQKIIGAIIIIISYGYIVFRLSSIKFDLRLIQTNLLFLILLCVSIFLSTINIFVESAKWKVLITNHCKITIGHSIKMVLAGFSTGIFTPAKLGEPYGRVIFLQKHHWTIGTILNYLSGAIQNIIIMLWGISFIMIASLKKDLFLYKLTLYTLFFSAISILLFLYLYFKRSKIYLYLSKYSWSQKILDSILTIKNIPIKNYLSVLLLSSFRYIIYCFQLVILLYAFSNQNIGSIFIIWIPIYFMCITIIPSFLIADLGIRNSVALFLFSQFNLNETSIMLSVSTLWIINQAIPASIGTIFIMKNQK